MLLHEGLIPVHSQKKPRLHFGSSFALTVKYKYLADTTYLIQVVLDLTIDMTRLDEKMLQDIHRIIN